MADEKAAHRFLTTTYSQPLKQIPKSNLRGFLVLKIMARFLNNRKNVIHKMVAYKCSKCNKWHIGNNGRFLTREDKEKYNEKLKLERHYIK